MKETFLRDLAAAKGAEQTVLETFKHLTTDYTFEDVSNVCSLFKRGDIKAINKATGKEIYIDVKDDSRIADTRNVLCEELVYYKTSGYEVNGFMYSDYDYLAIVSKSERKIYVIDFKILQKNYQKGELKQIDHQYQYSITFLCGLHQIKSWGALITTLDY